MAAGRTGWRHHVDSPGMPLIPPWERRQLRTEEDNKLSQILSQQRRYKQQQQQQQEQQQQQQQQQQQASTSAQHLPLHQPPTSSASAALRARARDVLKQYSSSAGERASSENESQLSTGLSVDTNVSDHQSGRRVWAVRQSSAPARNSPEDKKTDGRLQLQDVSNDDAQSTVSLLESDSVYLPFDVPASPVALRRPFSAPDVRSHPSSSSLPSTKPTPHSTPSPAAATTSAPLIPEHRKVLFSNPHLPARPATAGVESLGSKFSSLEQRPIKPFNQKFTSSKPTFDISLPPSSNSEPSLSHHKDSAIPTACSQDYDSSSEQTASESETLGTKVAKPKAANVEDRTSALASKETRQTADGILQSLQKEKLNLIKQVAGSKKAGRFAGASEGAGDKPGPDIRVRLTTAMKTSSTTATTTTTTTASSMAAAALLRNRLLKAEAETSPSARDLRGKGDNMDDEKAQQQMVTSKQQKSRLNLQRMETKKDGVGDSGFLSRPSSDAVMEDTQEAGIEHRAAIAIQSYWRGYWHREHNAAVMSIRKEIRARRAEAHIKLLQNDSERSRKLYEEEKQLRKLQMEAIRLLYQEVQVLKQSQSIDMSSTGGRSGHNTNASLAVDTSFSNSTFSAGASTGNSEMNRTKELEQTCAGLQTQVSQLQDALEHISSAVFRSNSLEGANFDLTDHSDNIHVLVNPDSVVECAHDSGESIQWSSIPHSLSPYPSEEEESYYCQVPSQGAPTPPRKLQLRHYSRNSLVLSWQSSSCPSGEEGEEGNSRIIGYRVYINDCLKAFVCQKTWAVVKGLNPSTTYKIYIKALSGFGESYESNIIMAGLAKGLERHKYSASSGSDDSKDSDKEDVDCSEKHKRRSKKRRSPRTGERKKSSRPLPPTSSLGHHLLGLPEGLAELQDEMSHPQNQNNSALDSSPILRHAKLHTHRHSRLKEQGGVDVSPKDNFSETTSKDSSPASGATSHTPYSSPADLATSSHQQTTVTHASPSSGSTSSPTIREGSRRLPESPQSKALKERIEAMTEESQKEAESQKAPNIVSNRRDSPTSRRGESSSSTISKRRKEGPESGKSPNISPSCGSDASSKVRMSPIAGMENLPNKTPVPISVGGIEKNSSQPFSLSETFTVEKSESYLERVSAIVEAATERNAIISGHRGHRRTRNRDYQLNQEKSRSTPELTNVEVAQEPLAVEAVLRLSRERQKEEAELHRGEEGEGGGDTPAREHRRKRSKDLNVQVAEWRKEEGEDELKGEKAEDGHARDGGSLGKQDEDGTTSSSRKDAPSASSSRPVIDGRRRHSSGSRPSSPVINLAERSSIAEDKTRMSVAEQMLEQRAKSLKSSSLNSLSGRSDDGQGAKADTKRSPSSESLPSSNSKRNSASNESLLSGGSGVSSRGDGSKYTHSSESLLSVRTDTSKRSQSNESLPGSARTESSRRSPSNESLPESIREESEQDISESSQSTTTSHRHSSQQSQSGCQRSQSIGSVKDVPRSSASSYRPSREASVSVSNLLQKLESITSKNSTNVRETKESLIRKRSSNEDSDTVGSCPPSDDEKRHRRSRHHSESDVEGAASDAGSQLPPRAPSESSSGSHSDDNRHHRRRHQRTSSDHRVAIPPQGDNDLNRPTHSPIIREGGVVNIKKSSGSNVRRNQSFHGLLPSKHADTKAAAAANEEVPTKPEEQPPAPPAQPEPPSSSRPRSSHLRSRSPSPARTRQPILSAAQLKRHPSDAGKSASTSGHDSSQGKAS